MRLNTFIKIFADRGGVAVFILLICFALTATSVAAPSRDELNAMVEKIGDLTVDGAERYNLLQDIGAMGSAAEPAAPGLCKLLKRDDPLPNHSELGQETARAIGRIGPEAAKAAVAAARADMADQTEVGEPALVWIEILKDVGPSAAPALAGALGDSNDSIVDSASRALELIAVQYPGDPVILRSLKTIGPRLSSAWQHAHAAKIKGDAVVRYPPQTFTERELREEPEQWLQSLYAIALISGPTAIDALGATAEAATKERPSDAADAAAAAGDFARAAADGAPANGMADPVQDDAFRKLTGFRTAAVAPLANLIASDAKARPLALACLNQMFNVSRAVATDRLRMRRRLIQGGSRAIIPLDRRNQAAIAKALPQIILVADTIHPDGQNQPASDALGILVAVAPDIPVAADTIVKRLDRIPDVFVEDVVNALSWCDAGVQKKVETAAAGGNKRARDIALRVQIRKLPPKEAAAKIAAEIPDLDRMFFISGLQGMPIKDLVPLLIELLPYPTIDCQGLLRDNAEDAIPILVAALDQPEPRIRIGVLQAFPAKAINADVIEKVASMLGDDEVGAEAVTFLIGAGDSALPYLVQRTLSPNAAARGRAAHALGAVASGANGPDAAEIRATAARVLSTLLDDSELSVRAAALNAVAELPDESRQPFASRLEKAGPAQLQQLGLSLAEATFPVDGQAVISIETEIQVANILLTQNAPAARRWLDENGIRRADAAFFVAEFTFDKDTAIAAAADNILLRAYVAQLDRINEQAPRPTPAEAAVMAAAAKNSDPKVRAQAVVQASAQRGSEEIVLAALDDKDPNVRIAAIRSIDVLVSRDSPQAPAAIVKLIRISSHDSMFSIRDWASAELQHMPRDRLSTLPQRLRLMAQSGDESDRATAATVMGYLFDPSAAASSGSKPVDMLGDLTPLITDSFPRVRAAAQAAVTNWVDFDPPDARAAKIIGGLLSNPAALDVESKRSMLDIVPWLAAGNANLARSVDPDIRAAALLGLEQVPMLNQRTGPLAPVSVAAQALASPSSLIRHMAAFSLITKDPANPNRESLGIQALLAASNNADDQIAINALDTLSLFCGSRIGPGVNTYKDFRAGAYWYHVTHFPTAYEVRVGKLYDRAFSGSIVNRLAAIREIGDGGPPLMAGRWNDFIHLLEDSDPQIRAAAFNVARKLTVQACTGGKLHQYVSPALPLRSHR